MRIVSLVPAGTEILFALGLERDIVAVSHECDYPPEAEALPRLTRSVIDGAHKTSAAIDAAVSARKATGAPLHHIDPDHLTTASPDLIITQGLCNVCALPSRAVREALANMSPRPAVVSLDGRSIEGIFDSMREIGEATGHGERASDVIESLRERIARVRSAVTDRDPVRVVCLEWLDPPYVCGHWIPEMVNLAGGIDLLGTPGVPSVAISWSAVRDANSPLIMAMPCGFTLERTAKELDTIARQPAWHQAIGDRTVYAVAGGGYFTRPGPRLVAGIELLASVFHPDRVTWPVPMDGLCQWHSRSHLQSTARG